MKKTKLNRLATSVEHKYEEVCALLKVLCEEVFTCFPDESFEQISDWELQGRHFVSVLAEMIRKVQNEQK